MRQVGLTDIYHAARVLQAVPQAERKDRCAQLLWQAQVADKCVKRLRKLHPLWGDGSLRAAALAQDSRGAAAPLTPELRACMALVLLALDRQKGVSSGREWLCSLVNCAK